MLSGMFTSLNLIWNLAALEMYSYSAFVPICSIEFALLCFFFQLRAHATLLKSRYAVLDAISRTALYTPNLSNFEFQTMTHSFSTEHVSWSQFNVARPHERKQSEALSQSRPFDLDKIEI